MISLKKLLLESIEIKYILPPNGDIFEVNDHVSWAAHNVLAYKYKNYSREHLAEVIDDIYCELETMGYLMLIWQGGTDELYVRGDNSILRLTQSQFRKIEKLAYKIADKGYSTQVKLIDDGDHEKILWQHPSINS
jgi:hypothetical protein